MKGHGGEIAEYPSVEPILQLVLTTQLLDKLRFIYRRRKLPYKNHFQILIIVNIYTCELLIVKVVLCTPTVHLGIVFHQRGKMMCVEAL